MTAVSRRRGRTLECVCVHSASTRTFQTPPISAAFSMAPHGAAWHRDAPRLSRSRVRTALSRDIPEDAANFHGAVGNPAGVCFGKNRDRPRLRSPACAGTVMAARCLTYLSSAAGRIKGAPRFLIAFTLPMKTQYYTAASLDGFIATEDDSLDWLFPLNDLDNSSYPDFIADVGALAMGSSTYEWLLRHSDEVIAETGAPWPYTQPAWVFTSRKLVSLEGADVRFVSGDVRIVHAQMRAAAGRQNIWIVGGGDLAGQFFDAGLLDELIIQIGSATLGTGKPLFPRRALSPTLLLTSVTQMGVGMAELRYAVAHEG